MAAYNVDRTAHKTLSGTTVDTATLTGEVGWLEIVNSGATDLTVTFDGTTPVANADGTEVVFAYDNAIFENPGRVVKILGNGNIYHLAAGK